MAKKCRTYTPEFREEAARTVVKTSRSIAEVGREFGINVAILGMKAEFLSKAAAHSAAEER